MHYIVLYYIIDARIYTFKAQATVSAATKVAVSAATKVAVSAATKVAVSAATNSQHYRQPKI